MERFSHRAITTHIWPGDWQNERPGELGFKPRQVLPGQSIDITIELRNDLGTEQKDHCGNLGTEESDDKKKRRVKPSFFI